MSMKKEIKRVRVSLLDIDPDYNCREDYGDIQQLKESISENGVLNPLVVYEDEQEDESVRYIVISGHRRRMACLQLIEEDREDFNVPVIIDNDLDETKKVTRIIIDNDGKPLTALEEAAVFLRLKKMGNTSKEIAKKCGRSKALVSNFLLLSSANKEMKSMIRNGTITVTAAIEKLRQKRKASISIEFLEQFLEQMESIKGRKRNEIAFSTMRGVIQWGRGNITNSEVLPFILKDYEKNSIK